LYPNEIAEPGSAPLAAEPPLPIINPSGDAASPVFAGTFKIISDPATHDPEYNAILLLLVAPPILPLMVNTTRTGLEAATPG
jgi:hypothetical protein